MVAVNKDEEEPTRVIAVDVDIQTKVIIEVSERDFLEARETGTLQELMASRIEGVIPTTKSVKWNREEIGLELENSNMKMGINENENVFGIVIDISENDNNVSNNVSFPVDDIDDLIRIRQILTKSIKNHINYKIDTLSE